jgi:hypothetical protein
LQLQLNNEKLKSSTYKDKLKEATKELKCKIDQIEDLKLENSKLKDNSYGIENEFKKLFEYKFFEEKIGMQKDVYFLK